MTLEHQTHMTNLITRIGWETRVAVAEGTLEESRKRLDSIMEELVTYMLFADEAPIRSPIEGVSSFTKTFPQRGPRDKQGRSLRDFDLEKRLFRYPLSYMVYSAAFDSLPDIARDGIYQKLYDVLTGKDTGPAFARLSAEDRGAVLEILRDTKPSLPAYWKNSAAP
jgi:lysyl-tRNA synthetase class I